jgi:hypothetical protein
MSQPHKESNCIIVFSCCISQLACLCHNYVHFPLLAAKYHQRNMREEKRLGGAGKVDASIKLKPYLFKHNSMGSITTV